MSAAEDRTAMCIMFVIKGLIIIMAGLGLWISNRADIAPTCGTGIWDLIISQTIIQTIQLILMFTVALQNDIIAAVLSLINVVFLIAGCAILIPAFQNKDCYDTLSKNNIDNLMKWPYLLIGGFLYVGLNALFVIGFPLLACQAYTQSRYKPLNSN